MKILIVEDNPGDARLVQEILKEARGDFTFHVAEKLGLGLKFLGSQDVDIVLLDLNLPDSHGLRTVTELQSRFSHLPVVVMTSIDDEELANQAVRLGAQDYLVKGRVDSELLRRTLIHAIDRKRVEEAVLKAKEEWELTFDSVPDLIAILDCEHRVIRANKAMADRLGVTPEKCVGLPCYQAVHGLSHPPEFCPHSLTCRDGKEHIVDVHEPRLGGYFSVSTTPVVNKQGLTTGSIHVARDITERKKAEEELKKRSAELEAVNKELEAFSYSVSHDLRAPLRGMDGFANIILEDYADRLDAQGKEYLGHIRSSSKLMAQLIDDLLRLSRISRAELNSLKVNLSDLALSIADELRGVQPDRQAAFSVQPELYAQGDESLLRILLYNLLENAWKYTSRSSEAKIEFSSTRLNGEEVFSVKDNGVGFNMEYANKLFQPFQRLHSSTEYPGTGIGLAIVQRIISRHGGRVWAEGKIGSGAIFYFTLR